MHTPPEQPSRYARWTPWWTYFGYSLLAAPLSILLHEAAHLAVATALGFPDVRFGYQSVTYAGEERLLQLVWEGRFAEADSIQPLVHVGWTAMAGPLLNWVLAIALAAVVHRRRSRLAAAVGALLAGRAFMIGWFVMFEPAHSRNDEDLVGRLLGVSPAWLAGAGIVLAMGALVWMLRAIRPAERLAAVVATAAGGVLGGYAYLVHVGPLLLP
jgi:hypothetical protein